MACFSVNLKIDLVKLFEGWCIIFPKKRLERRMEVLKRKHKDVIDIIDQQVRQQHGIECKVVVKSWLEAVVDKEEEVNRVLDSLAQRCGCTCCCYTHNRESMEDLIESVSFLVEEGRRYGDGEFVCVIQSVPAPICTQNDLKRKMNGLKMMHKCIADNQPLPQQFRIFLPSRSWFFGPETLLSSWLFKKRRKECKVAAKSWLEVVNRKEEEVNHVLQSIEQRCGSTCCCYPSDRQNVGELIDTINELVKEGINHAFNAIIFPSN